MRDRRISLASVLSDVPVPHAAPLPALVAATRLLIAACLGFGAQSAVAQDVSFFQIGTGATGGTAFAVGSVIAGALSTPPGSVPCEDGGPCGVPGMVAVALTTKGSVDNVERLAAGTINAALVDADVVYWAYHGTGLFEGRPPMSGLRAIANLYPAVVHIVVPADSAVQSPADLTGLRVAVGEPGSGSQLTAKTVLSAFGVDFADLGLLEIRPGPAADLLARDGLDALVVTGGVPITTVTDLAKRRAVRILPIDGTVGEDLTSFAPFLTRAAIPPKKYKDVPRTVSIAVGVQLIVSTAAEPDMIEAITRALWHDRSLGLYAKGPLEVVRPTLDQARTGIAIPLHEGARRYYRALDAKPAKPE